MFSGSVYKEQWSFQPKVCVECTNEGPFRNLIFFKVEISSSADAAKTPLQGASQDNVLWSPNLYHYSGISRKGPPLMSGLGGCLREVVAYGKFH